MHKPTRRALAAALPLAAPAAAAALIAPTHAEALPRSFEWALEAHLNAIKTRDLASLERTLTRENELFLVLPNGALTRTKAEYLDFHRQWFAVEGWTIEFEEVWAHATVAIGQAMYRTRYADTNTDGTPYQSSAWLTLTFRSEGSQWRLWHDQNTRIPAA